MNRLIETPLSPPTYRSLTKALGLTDEAICRGLNESGLLGTDENGNRQEVTLKMVKHWRAPERHQKPRRPFHAVSIYLQQWLDTVFNHEEALIERYDAQYEQTGEPVTIYIPRRDTGITENGALSKEWEPYIGFIPVAHALGARVHLRLLSMGIPSRIDFIENLVYRQSVGGDEPQWRDDEVYTIGL